MAAIHSVNEFAYGLLAAVARGEYEVRDRANEEPCPRCKGAYDISRRSTEKGRRKLEEDGLYADYSGRWFCYCGYAEAPQEDADEEAVAAWREDW